MKKITLTVALFAISFGYAQEFKKSINDAPSENRDFNNSQYAQQTLSHSESDIVLSGGVACLSDPTDGQPGSGDEFISDNIFYRAYTPSEFGYSGDFQAQGISFYARFVDIGGTNPTIINTVRLYTSSDVFPAGTLTEIASKDFEVSAADNNQLLEIIFDEAVIVDASTELIVAVDISEGRPAPNNYDFRIGVNDLGESAPSYLSSTACGLTTPSTFASIGFPDNHIILNLLGDTFLNSSEFLANSVSIFPNPAKDIINLEIPSSIEFTSGTLYDLTGKDTGLRIQSKSINVSSLSSGVYLLKIQTTEGSVSKKVIIQ
ncbi:T9SS type A sorting domain-containing protein [Psychroflexus tropicus]|uniref:T9SS type A sorting domain-containing protein n=1 Tax=Psychroflexus tropicus TaxID=197345 RepID=UPI00036E2634|nr:T9SS type A sorting domain-containing protein [Psychroflexus tropicus]